MLVKNKRIFLYILLLFSSIIIGNNFFYNILSMTANNYQIVLVMGTKILQGKKCYFFIEMKNIT
jgi:hypothetical protein